MTKPVVFVTRRWPAKVECRLSELFQPIFNVEDKPLSQNTLAAAMLECDALLPTVTDQITDKVLSQKGNRTQIVANYGVGYSHIDIAAAERNRITVTNTPDVLSECTADLAIALMLMTMRRAGEGERELRSGAWTGWRPTHMIGQKVTGKTLGIIGFGRIGRETARRAHLGFGMKILVHNRSAISQDLLAEFGAIQVGSINELVAQSDIVSIHCPGGVENCSLIGGAQFERMKPTGILVNTARGEVVDEDALVNALQQNLIAGAGLDVFIGEPLVHQGLTTCNNVVLLPHLGSATRETREAMGFRVIQNLVDYFDGRPPRDCITPTLTAAERTIDA